MTYRLGLRRCKPWLLMVCTCVVFAPQLYALDIETARMVGLMRDFDETTVYWRRLAASRCGRRRTARPLVDGGMRPTILASCAAEHRGAHLAGANVVVFENLVDLDALPRRGAVVFAPPMKIRGGSSGPLRAVASVP